MSTYRKEWDCCGSVTETDAWEPDRCPFCSEDADELDRLTARVAELERQLQPSEIFLQCAKHIGQPWPLTIWTTGNPPPIQVCPNCKHAALEHKHD